MTESPITVWCARVPARCRIARLVGVGIRPEHVRTPAAGREGEAA